MGRLLCSLTKMCCVSPAELRVQVLGSSCVPLWQHKGARNNCIHFHTREVSGVLSGAENQAPGLFCWWSLCLALINGQRGLCTCTEGRRGPLMCIPELGFNTADTFGPALPRHLAVLCPETADFRVSAASAPIVYTVKNTHGGWPGRFGMSCDPAVWQSKCVSGCDDFYCRNSMCFCKSSWPFFATE